MILLSLFCAKVKRQQQRLRTGLIMSWLIAMVFLSDETNGVLHSLRKPPAPENSWRVVSLNCSVGTPEAAREVISYKPDLVLLQESPSRQDIQNLARQLWKEKGNSVWGVDGSVLANGKVEPLKLPAPIAVFATAARVTIKENKFAAVSFRLNTPPFRVDFWNPSAWQALMAHRTLQRAQLKSLLAAIQSLEPDLPIVMAGDCNAPAGDAIFRELQPALHDAYREGAAGWCDTFQNDFPVLRIDQMWISSYWQAAYLTAHRTQNSDHRMVICDVVPAPKN